MPVSNATGDRPRQAPDIEQGPEAQPPPSKKRGGGFNQSTDAVIRVAGSAPVLGAAGLFEGGWLIAGVPAHFSNGWQLAMGDVSTITVFLMNPVLQNAENRHKQHLQAHYRRAVHVPRQLTQHLKRGAPRPNVALPPPTMPSVIPLSRFDRGVDAAARVVGSPRFFACTLAGIGVWAGSGYFLHFSDTWQLIINSATSAFELPAALGLHNVKLRDDTALASRLAAETQSTRYVADMLGYHGFDDTLPPESTVSSGRLTRSIDFVARLEGSAAALAVHVGVVLAWPVMGHPMHWGNTWQLVLGTMTTIPTYVLLLVLMNTQNRHIRHVERQSAALVAHYEDMLGCVAPRGMLQRHAAHGAARHPAGYLSRFATACNNAAGSPLGLVVGLCGIPAWAVTKTFLNFTTWMLLINSGTMIAQTLAFILLIGAHARADEHAKSELDYAAQLRCDLVAAVGASEAAA